MIRLIALDLDGTLLGPNNQISPADEAAVRAALERGVHVVLATSRWYGLARHTALRLGLETPIICHNGAHVLESNGGADLLHLRIPMDMAREICALSDEGGYETYTTVNGTTFVRADWTAHVDAARFSGDMRPASNHADHVTAPATGILVFGDEGVRAVTEAFAERYAGALTFPAGWSETMRPYVTITAAGADKGRGLRLACEHLAVPLEETMAVGDTAPDVPMFEVAGLGVAMGNAPEEVQLKADAVAPSNTEEGVAWAIRRYVQEEG